jgi:hypothetical protein
VHQLAIDAVMGYALGARCCNLDGIQLSSFCMVMQQQHTENLSEGWTAQGTMNNIIHHIFYQVT